MNMRIPIITAESRAVRELLKDKESCLFVRRADPFDLAQKIITLIDDPGLDKKLADNARYVYEKKVSLHIIIERLIAIIKGQI